MARYTSQFGSVVNLPEEDAKALVEQGVLTPAEEEPKRRTRRKASEDN